MSADHLTQTLTAIAHRYPEDMIAAQVADVPRIAFHIRTTLAAASPKPAKEIAVADLGGGVGLFSVGMAGMGVKRSVLVDDFGDPVNRRMGEDDPLKIHEQEGVEIVSRDVIAVGIGDLPGTFDVITSFESMEHWHHSPKRLFGEVIDKLNPEGSFVLGVPNCSDLAKRILTPLGRAKWSYMDTWYEQEVFRGHVREADVDDLRYIARDLGLRDTKILGRYFPGESHLPALIGAAMNALHIPSLCSSIYLVGRRPSVLATF